MRRERRSDESGFTLVEMLVSVVIVGVVGAVVTQGIVTSFRVSSAAQARLDALSELQLASERVGRELRSASPILVSTTGDFDHEIVAQVNRDNTVQVHTFRVRTNASGIDEIVQSVKIYTAGTDPFATPAPTPTEELDTVLITTTSNIDLGTPTFTYFRTPDSQITCAGTTATCIPIYSEAQLLAITLTRNIGDEGEPVRVSTFINVRNTRYGS